MAQTNDRCPGCMRIRTQHPICEHCGWDERTENSAYELPAGTVLRGQYQIGRVLGQGGFGITYLAFDRYLEIPVAIKEYFPSGLVSRDCTFSTRITSYTGTASELYEDSKRRFMQEGKGLAKFSDLKNIVTIHNFFPENNTVYMVMEFADGITLKEKLCKEHTLSYSETMGYLTPIMQDLAQVHREGVIHRDISPDNIMLLKRGGAKLLDFGAMHLTQNTAVDAEAQKSTTAILKQGFAPLEQYNARGTLGPWTDVYALCATICTCLSGKVPEPAPERASCDEPDAFLEQMPGLSPALRQVLKDGMALRPRDRISGVPELMSRLWEAQQISSVWDPEKTAILYPDDDKTVVMPQPERNFEKKADAPVTPPVTPKKSRKPIWMIGALMILSGAAAAGFLLKKDPAPAITEETETVTEFSETAFSETVLSETTLPQTEATEPVPYVPVPQDLVLKNADPEGKSKFAFGSEILKKDVKSITFLPSIAEAPEDALDLSETGMGQILLWSSGSDLYIGCSGTLQAPANCSYLFGGKENKPETCYENLESIVFQNTVDFSQVRNFSWAFSQCEKLTDPDLSCLQNSEATDLSGMFSGCKSLKVLNLPNLRTENAEDLSYLFSSCVHLKELNFPGLDTSSAKNLSHLFGGCNSLETVDLTGFHTENAEDLSGMFFNCKSLTELDLSAFDTSHVRNMADMFHFCKKITSLNLTGFDTGNVQDMTGLFENCSGLTKLDLSGFDTSHVLKMDRMFYDCYRLESINLSGFDTAGVSTMHFMFRGCRGLKALDLSHFVISGPETANGIFSECSPSTKLTASQELMEAFENSAYDK